MVQKKLNNQIDAMGQGSEGQEGVAATFDASRLLDAAAPASFDAAFSETAALKHRAPATHRLAKAGRAPHPASNGTADRAAALEVAAPRSQAGEDEQSLAALACVMVWQKKLNNQIDAGRTRLGNDSGCNQNTKIIKPKTYKQKQILKLIHLFLLRDNEHNTFYINLIILYGRRRDAFIIDNAIVCTAPCDIY